MHLPEDSVPDNHQRWAYEVRHKVSAVCARRPPASVTYLMGTNQSTPTRQTVHQPPIDRRLRFPDMRILFWAIWGKIDRASTVVNRTTEVAYTTIRWHLSDGARRAIYHACPCPHVGSPLVAALQIAFEALANPRFLARLVAQ